MGYFAKRVTEFNIGHWAISKIQWLVSMVILLKLFEVVWWVYILACVIVLVATQLIGIFIHRTGLWDNYIKEIYHGIRDKKPFTK